MVTYKELEELKKQGIYLDKEKTPLDARKYQRDLWSREPHKISPCYMCEFSHFDGREIKCEKGHGPFNSLEETMFRCEDKELDDYYYDLDKAVFK